jgi:hypothetical protein
MAPEGAAAPAAEANRRVLFCRRLVYGRPRRPLEPHRPLPYLLRAVSWLLLGLGFVCGGPAAVVLASAGAHARAVASASAAAVLVSAGAAARVCALLTRPPVLDLSPHDEEES